LSLKTGRKVFLNVGKPTQQYSVMSKNGKHDLVQSGTEINDKLLIKWSKNKIRFIRLHSSPPPLSSQIPNMEAASSYKTDYTISHAR
jgi:hypothetical protein